MCQFHSRLHVSARIAIRHQEFLLIQLCALLTPTGVSCLTNKIEGYIGLMQLCISVSAVGMFCINTHACRELTCWLHMNRPNLHNAKLLLTVAVKRQNVWSFPVVTRCYEQRTSKRTESCLGVRIPFLLPRYGTLLIIVQAGCFGQCHHAVFYDIHRRFSSTSCPIVNPDL